MRYLQLFVLMTLPLFADAQQSENVQLLCNWNDTAHVRATPNGQRYNDVWGFTTHGREYAVIGSTEGLHVIDVNECRQVVFYPGKDAGDYVIHRDYKTYKNYLYAVCDEGISSLQVFDLKYLPDSLHLVYETNPLELMQAHTIFIDTAKATLYACSAKSMGSSDFMRVYSIADPEAAPVLLTQYNLHDKVHAVYVRNDTAYCSSSFYGLEIVDFSSHDQHYQNIGELHFYPYQGYNHSNWIRPDGIGVMADETHAMPVKVIDTRNLLNVRVMSSFSPRPGDSTCVPHNPYLVGDYAFVSYYFDGLQIYDISDPLNPRRAGYYDTYPGQSFSGFSGAWGCYPFLPSGKVLVSDMQTGLYIFDVSGAVKKADTTQASFSIYPNPVREKLNLRFPEADTGTVSIAIYDAAGRNVRQYTATLFPYSIQPIQLTLPGYLSAGTYFISIKTGAHQYKEKFTKR